MAINDALILFSRRNRLRVAHEARLMESLTHAYY